MRAIHVTFLTLIVVICAMVEQASAHHILGRPSYSLNEDSNTPPAVQVETQLGNHMLTYMVFPDVPSPGKPGRINLYMSSIKDGKPYDGKVTFKVRNDDLLAKLGFGVHLETLGVQASDDNVFRQGVLFGEAGDYILIADYRAGGENYSVEFPLRVGVPSSVGPAGLAIGAVALVLIVFGVVQRRRAMTGKIRGSQAESADQ